MTIRISSTLAALVCTAAGFLAPNAAALPAPDAPEVALKQDCGTNPDCFTNAATLLDWVWTTRNPDAGNPLLVSIDPGTYVMPGTMCSIIEPTVVSERGHVTFRGSGRENTILSPQSGVLAVIDVHGCSNLAIESLTVDGTTGSNRGVFGVIWREGGSSVWSNVNVRAFGYGWYDTGSNFSGGTCQDGPPGRHEWYGSAIRTVGTFFGFNVGYHSGCGDTWIYGSELAALHNGTPSFLSLQAGANTKSSTASIHLYGTDVMVLASEGASAVPVQVGLQSKDGGTIHHHGGEIVVKHENTLNDQTVISLQAQGEGGRVHVLETSFGLLPAGNGNAIRVEATGGGSVSSAFEWPAGTLAPTPGDATGNNHLVSADGQDSFVETDCPLIGGCQNGGGFPHTMVYTSNCTGTGPDQGPWFDTVTGNCRGL